MSDTGVSKRARTEVGRAPYDAAVEERAELRGGAGPETLDRLWAWLATLPRGGQEEGWTARVRWIEAACAWISEERGTARLVQFAAACRAEPGRTAALRDAFQAVFESGYALRLLADGGFPQRHSLVEESFVRLVRGVVPPVPESRDLGDVVEGSFGGDRAAAWLAATPPAALADLLEAAGLGDAQLWPSLRTHLAEALRLHGLRCASIGLSEDVRRALGRAGVAQSPFHRIDAAAADLMEAASGPTAAPAKCAAARVALERCINDARAERTAVLDHLEATGVSTGLVHRLDLLARALDRIEAALPILAPRAGERPAEAVAALLKELVGHIRHDASLLNAFRDRSRLLARKIIDFAAESSSDYIAVDRAAWWRLLWMGCGGGIVISIATWLKAFVVEIHPPPGTMSLLVFLDYAAAFLVIYALHWTLATKQPPATAAAMADALAKLEGTRDTRPIQDLMARISRSQLAGLIGNVLFAAAGCVAIDAIHRLMAGRPVLHAEDAVKVLREHSPYGSGTILYSIVTGFAVWLSSMAAGWAQNAAAYGRLKESFVSRDPAVGRTLGERITGWVVNNLGGVVGNVSLALFLVSIAFVGKIFGVPLDIRHVTLSTGMVTFSSCSLLQITTPDVLWAIAGVACIGFLNITTGFLLSLSVAMRARGVSIRRRFRMLPVLITTPLRRPLSFLYPFGRDATG